MDDATKILIYSIYGDLAIKAILASDHKHKEMWRNQTSVQKALLGWYVISMTSLYDTMNPPDNIDEEDEITKEIIYDAMNNHDIEDRKNEIVKEKY
jgi:hypothetical protein